MISIFEKFLEKFVNHCDLLGTQQKQRKVLQGSGRNFPALNKTFKPKRRTKKEIGFSKNLLLRKVLVKTTVH